MGRLNKYTKIYRIEEQICKDFASLLFINKKSSLEDVIYNQFLGYDDRTSLSLEKPFIKNINIKTYENVLFIFFKRLKIDQEIVCKACLKLSSRGYLNGHVEIKN